MAEVLLASAPSRPAFSRLLEGLAGRLLLLLLFPLLSLRMPGAEPVRNLSEIHRLPPGSARTGREFAVEAIVTYFNANWPVCFVQDDTAGFYVHLDFKKWRLTAGDRISAEGELGADGLPTFRRLTLLQSGATFPSPRSPQLAEIARGEHDSIRVRLTGWPVNRWSQNRHHVIDMIGEFGERFHAVLPEETIAADTIESWLGGRLEVQGVCGFEFNSNGVRVGFRVWVPSPDHVTVEPLDFSSPLTQTIHPIAAIRSQNFDRDHPRPLRVEGTVTLQTGPRMIYIQDATGGTLVRTEQPVQFGRGLRVTALGVAAEGAYSPFLNHARIRPAQGGNQEPVRPKVSGVAELIAGHHEAELVSVEGRVITSFREADQCGWILEARETLFMALLPMALADRLSVAVPGSTLRVDGVCEVKVDQARKPRAFAIRLGAPSDFTVTQALPWWTLDRLLVLLAGVAGLAGVGLAWAATLRRQVSAQTRRIEEQFEQIRTSEERHRSVTESIAEGILVTDLDDVIVDVNPQMAKLTGYRREELVGRRALELFVPPSERAGIVEHNRRRANGESEHYEQRLLRRDGTELWALVIASPLRDAGGRVIGTVGVNLDITRQKLADEALTRSLAEKDTLLREVHHRVKNNLQVISSLLHFQQKKNLPPEVAADLRQSQSRITAIALVHERLYESGNLSQIRFDTYLRDLAAQIMHGTAPERGRIGVEVTGQSFTLGINEAVPCALIINELLSNSLKHAFPDGRTGTVRIELGLDPAGTRTVTVRDDGVGLPPGGEQRTPGTLGLRLVSGLVDQLQGKLERITLDRGTCFRITLEKAQ